jgi:hypothetical protein
VNTSGADFFLGFDPEDEGDVPPKRRLAYNGLHGVISQKLEVYFEEFLRHSFRMLLSISHGESCDLDARRSSLTSKQNPNFSLQQNSF